MSHQPNLFDPTSLPATPAVLAGLRYQPDVVSPAEERGLIERLETLTFEPFAFHGYVGRRRVVSYGWRYDFTRRVLEAAAPIPDFLIDLRLAVAGFTGHDPAAFGQVLVLEYRPGAAIGWHRDRPQFEDIAGVSLASPCPLRFRRRRSNGWDRATITAAPRSAYLLQGPTRTDWEHSIPPVTALRYSVTFRTFNARLAPAAVP